MYDHRSERLAGLIKEELGKLLQKEIKDPRIGFVSITKVKVSRDRSHAKVYISVFGDKSQQESAMEGLESAKGFIRLELGKRIRSRHTPEIQFIADSSLEESARIFSLLDQISGERGEKQQ
ncbi:MAG: 30S ribosome-binding factor RbfA [Firmicutes bacterium]|nr:30S ribosome-binding factor RbfA [Bacillota bacterium]